MFIKDFLILIPESALFVVSFTMFLGEINITLALTRYWIILCLKIQILARNITVLIYSINKNNSVINTDSFSTSKNIVFRNLLPYLILVMKTFL